MTKLSKYKFFGIGFLTSVLLILTILFVIFKKLKNEKEKGIKTFVNKETSNLTFDIVKFDGNILNDVEFINVTNNNPVLIDNCDFLLINFWATWCSPCIGEFPSFDKLINDKDIQKIPIKFIFSNYENIETQKKFIIKNKLDMIFCKPKDSLPKIFETNSIPTTYIIDKKNNLAYKTIGCENWNSQLIKSFLKGL